MNRVKRRRPSKRMLERDHLVQHGAEREQVGAVIHGGPVDLLRRHGREGAGKLAEPEVARAAPS